MDCDDDASCTPDAGGCVARKPGYVSPSVARGAMLRHGLTGLQVAARVGVNPSTVRNWLAGRTAPTPAKLAALAQVLELNVRDLTGVLPGRETLSDMRVHAASREPRRCPRGCAPAWLTFMASRRGLCVTHGNAPTTRSRVSPNSVHLYR